MELVTECFVLMVDLMVLLDYLLLLLSMSRLVVLHLLLPFSGVVVDDFVSEV